MHRLKAAHKVGVPRAGPAQSPVPQPRSPGQEGEGRREPAAAGDGPVPVGCPSRGQRQTFRKRRFWQSRGTGSLGMAAGGTMDMVGMCRMCPNQHVRDAGHPSWLGARAAWDPRAGMQPEGPRQALLALTWGGSGGRG